MSLLKDKAKGALSIFSSSRSSIVPSVDDASTVPTTNDVPKPDDKNSVGKVPSAIDHLKSKAKSKMNTFSDKFFNDEGQPMSKNQRRKKEKADAKRERRIARDDERLERQRQIHEDDIRAEKEETPEQKGRYGHLALGDPANDQTERCSLGELGNSDDGKSIAFRARLHTIRSKSAALSFCVFRQQGVTLQGVLEAGGDITEHMLRWVGRVPVESIMLVSGTLRKPPAPVKGTSIHDLELAVERILVIAEAAEALPFSVYQEDKVIMLRGADGLHPGGHAEPLPLGHIEPPPPRSPSPQSASPQSDSDDGGSDSDSQEEQEQETRVPQLSDRSRFASRVIDLRTAPSQAIFRIQAGVCALFRSQLDARGFVEIHTPKLQGGATESGATVFELNYFGRKAFLAQSPQLAKQMCVAADFERVYEVGAVFRAENSNTHRHLTEYTGLDLEMAFERDYHEVMNIIDETIKGILKGIHERCAKELEDVRLQFPSEPLQWTEKTPVITFREGIQMLHDAGFEDANEEEDLSTRAEVRLGELVKEKFGTDYYILDKFPTAARPFYVMPDAKEAKFSNTFDIFLRGQEIVTGGQRIHDAGQLEDAMAHAGVRPEAMPEYMEAFRWATPPHAGCGFGLERLVMLLLALPDIRNASLFPRDPRSLQPPPEGETLRHPEASTLNPPWARHRDEAAPSEMPPLEKLIANYGDAPHTAWLDRRFEVWRHAPTGAAVGYGRAGRYCLVVGDPLCDQSQQLRVAAAFLRWARKEVKLKPLWLLVSEHFEKVLGEKMGWRTMTCVAEARVDTSLAGTPDPGVARKVRHAEGEGVAVTDIPAGQEVPEDVRGEVDVRLKDWQDARTGRQVHITDLDPWSDHEHRRYFIARDRTGRVCGLVVLAQLAIRHGFQVKWALDFPEAPGGTIELIVLHALKAAQTAGARTVTFGATPAREFRAGSNLGALRARMLRDSYSTIAHGAGLLKKSEFKEKLGAEQDPEYIAYPPRGLGPMAVRSIMKWLGDKGEDGDGEDGEGDETPATSYRSGSRSSRPTSMTSGATANGTLNGAPRSASSSRSGSPWSWAKRK